MTSRQGLAFRYHRNSRQVHAVRVGIGERRHVGCSIFQGEGTQAVIEIIACGGYENIAMGQAG